MAIVPDPPTGDEPAIPTPEQIPLTDLGNVIRLHRAYGKIFRHNTALGWMHWNGMLWEPDDSEAQIGCTGQELQRLVRAEAKELNEAGVPDQAVKLLHYARRTQAATTISNALKLWKPRAFTPAFVRPALRGSPCNGILDLETGSWTDSTSA